jgi:Phenylpropionate dioxygenase and related ring-hydroxylating dioxygenases, large terminal subunit
MLSYEDNERLVRIGAETPMGALLRRFWIPALLSSEVPDPDSPPARVRLLGEDLVAFRDSNGQVGLIDAYCPHRRAPMFFGRNEECGLRCVYHGWKFDVSGRCVDMPNVPKGEALKNAMRITAYPTRERSGVVWAYMGPQEAPPEPSAAEAFDVPVENRHLQKMIVRGNWVQFMEGDIDSSHVSFLHSRIDKKHLGPNVISGAVFEDSAPYWTVTSMPYGLKLAARRNAGSESYSWRVNQWLLPFTTMVASPAGQPFVTNMRIPIDDEHTMHLRMYVRLDGPLNEDDRALIESGLMFPEMIPGTFTTKANITNDYLIDREDQRTGSYTGIKSVPAQDYAVVQGQGVIAERWREKLTQSDKAIVAMRTRLLNAADSLASGKEPEEAQNADAYRVRPLDQVLPREGNIDEALEANSRRVGEKAPAQ